MAASNLNTSNSPKKKKSQYIQLSKAYEKID